MTRMQECVQRGVDLLDKQVPGWREKIDVNALAMNNCSRCILGQLFGDYAYGMRRICPGLPELYGFDSPSGERFDILRDYWIHHITNPETPNA